MLDFVKRIATQGLNRDEARQARKQKQTRAQPFVYRYQAPTRDFTIEVKFRRSSVEHEELVDALRTAVEELGKVLPETPDNNY
jgi:ParB family chromosome partitioning protein